MPTIKERATPRRLELIRTSPYFEKYRTELFEMWERVCGEHPMMALPYTEYRKFYDSGDRNGYENYYFMRRHAISCASILALIYPEEQKYIDRLQDEIFAMCDEYSWCLPAHQKNWETPQDDFIDLFAAETGFALAEIYTLLGERFDPLVKTRLLQTIRHRILDSFEKNDYFWCSNCYNNWAAVCTGSVACTIMYLFPEEMPIVLPRIHDAMDHFLKGFSRDGVCLEGCGYWSYGFGFFVVFADMLRTFTNGKEDYFKREDVKRISTFMQNMFLTGTASVSFADGGPSARYHMGLLHYLKDEYPQDIMVYAPEYSYNYDHCGRYCLHLRAALWVNAEYLEHPDTIKEQSEFYAPDAEWYLRKNATYSFAAKGGYNDEPHNHNDAGTFIVASNGKQLLMDAGPGEYTRQYFRLEHRYNIIECSSLGHSLPYFGEHVQKVGVPYRASSFEYKNNTLTCEIAKAYDFKELQSLVRTFAFNDTGFVLKDTFNYTGTEPITERFVSKIQPLIKGNIVTIENCTITFDPKATTPHIVEIPSTREPVYTIYAIDFTFDPKTKEAKFQIKVQN